MTRRIGASRPCATIRAFGGDLLTIGLQSPVTRNRKMALNAFQQRPAESWPSEAGRVLRGEPSE